MLSCSALGNVVLLLFLDSLGQLLSPSEDCHVESVGEKPQNIPKLPIPSLILSYYLGTYVILRPALFLVLVSSFLVWERFGKVTGNSKYYNLS